MSVRRLAPLVGAMLLTTIVALGPSVEAEPRRSADPGPQGSGGRVEPRIVGGNPASDGEWPWAVRLSVHKEDGWYLCGGSIIDPRWVLTAAHCLDHGSEAFVYYGSNDADEQTGVRYVGTDDFFSHPNYGAWWTMDSDVALIHLDDAIPVGETLGNGFVPKLTGLNGASSVLHAPPSLLDPLPGDLLTVVGWGEHENDAEDASLLYEVQVPFLSDDDCEDAYGWWDITDTMFCAGDLEEGGIDSCQGDSGGPIMMQTPAGVYQVGVVSWGEGCADPGKPGVYADLAMLAPWVEETVCAVDGPPSCDVSCDAPLLPLGGFPSTAVSGEATWNGVRNMGFETDFGAAWWTGAVTDAIDVVGSDGYAAPYEGSKMLRIGRPPGDGSISGQPIGPNVVCQIFTATHATERFVYQIATHDYTGFDHFTFQAKAASTGEVLTQHFQQAWGVGTGLKMSGWRYVEIDLSDHIGEDVVLQFSAGGTYDTLFRAWMYLDSAASGAPETPVDVSDVDSDSGSVMVDPQTGQITVGMPQSQLADVTLTLQVTCPDGGAPSSVLLLLDGDGFPMTPVPGTPHSYSGTIPAEDVAAGTLTTQIACPSEVLAQTLGTIQLYDPSGQITTPDGEPVEGAVVTLHKVPGWTPAADASEVGEGKCETTLTKAEGAPWSQAIDPALGVKVSPFSEEISPNVNPFVTNADGRYGWDVAAGCWFVAVTADGYHPLVSPVVGVPPEVTDLDLVLTPRVLGVATIKPPADTSFAGYEVALHQAGEPVATCHATATGRVLACDAEEGREGQAFPLPSGALALEAGAYTYDVVFPTGAVASGKLQVGAAKPAVLALAKPPKSPVLSFNLETAHLEKFDVAIHSPSGPLGTCAFDDAARTVACEGEGVAAGVYPRVLVASTVVGYEAVDEAGNVLAKSGLKVKPGKPTPVKLKFPAEGKGVRLDLGAAWLPSAQVAFRSSEGTALGVCTVSKASLSCAGDAVALRSPYLLAPAGAVAYDVTFPDGLAAKVSGKLKLTSGAFAAIKISPKPTLAPLLLDLSAAPVSQVTATFAHASTPGECVVDALDRTLECSGSAKAGAFPYVLLPPGAYGVALQPEEDAVKPFQKPGLKLAAKKPTTLKATFGFHGPVVALAPAGGLVDATTVVFRDAQGDALGACDVDLAAASMACTGDGVTALKYPFVGVPSGVAAAQAESGPLFKSPKVSVKPVSGKAVKVVLPIAFEN